MRNRHPLAYWHGSLALSRSGHYLATVMWASSIGLALQFSRRHSVSSDSNVVARTLLAQINYTADVRPALALWWRMATLSSYC